MVHEQPNSHLVQDLCGESQYLAVLHKMFCLKYTFKDSKIISVYETMDTRTVEVNIVLPARRTNTDAFRNSLAPISGLEAENMYVW